jgi:hypothetical protein
MSCCTAFLSREQANDFDFIIKVDVIPSSFHLPDEILKAPSAAPEHYEYGRLRIHLHESPNGLRVGYDCSDTSAELDVRHLASVGPDLNHFHDAPPSSVPLANPGFSSTERGERRIRKRSCQY